MTKKEIILADGMSDLIGKLKIPYLIIVAGSAYLLGINRAILFTIIAVLAIICMLTVIFLYFELVWQWRKHTAKLNHRSITQFE